MRGKAFDQSHIFFCPLSFSLTFLLLIPLNSFLFFLSSSLPLFLSSEIDEQSPEFITCPPNIDLFIDPVESSALVKLADLRATDNSGVVVLENNLPFRVSLADSPLQRTLIAEDMSENQGACALTVTLTPTSGK